MTLAALAVFLAGFFNTLRIVSYLPQILKIARDPHGATAISFWTWGLWTAANASTAFYAYVCVHDLGLTAVNSMNAVCCIVVIGLTIWKRRRQRMRERQDPSNSAQTRAATHDSYRPRRKFAEFGARLRVLGREASRPDIAAAGSAVRIQREARARQLTARRSIMSRRGGWRDAVGMSVAGIICLSVMSGIAHHQMHLLLKAANQRHDGAVSLLFLHDRDEIVLIFHQSIAV